MTIHSNQVQITGSNLDFWPRGKVLFEDKFEDGLDGWEWLMNGTTPMPGPIWTARRTNRGSGAMLLATGDAQDGTKFGSAMAIKRLTLPYSDGIHYAKVGAEYIFGFSSNSSDRPRAFDFGFDTQLQDGTRHWYKIRFQNFDETANQITGKWQVLDNTYPYTDVPGGGGFAGWNQGKSNLYHIKFVVDLQAQKYVSLWVNGKTFDLSSYSAPTVDANQPDFNNGFNYTVQIFNRNPTDQPNWCRMIIPYVRGTVE